MHGKRIVLGVCGSIAAYRAADIASKLVRAGADVWCVMTPEATRFIAPATFQALTKNPVIVDVFDEPIPGKLAHIALAQESDLILVAPATAHLIARMALGLADDALTALLLAATAPILLAPAMNTQMLGHPATKHHLSTLATRGVGFVGTRSGVLVCGTDGDGKLAETPTVLESVREALSPRRDLSGKRILVTAGGTREPIDPVRFLTNRSSGKMGVAIAEAAVQRGAHVTLVHGPVSVPVPPGVVAVPVQTTADLLNACRTPAADADWTIAAAAPADYTAAEVAPQKLKKTGDALTLRLVPTPDVIATLTAQRRPGQRFVAFAAETEELIAHAAEKLVRKRVDLIVANDVAAEGSGFEVDTNRVTLLFADGRQEALPLLTKREVADRLLDAIARLDG